MKTMNGVGSEGGRGRRVMTWGLLLGLVAGMSGCDLPAGDKTSPQYWGEVFLEIYADELIVGELEPGPEPLVEPRAVLLITGVTIPAQWFDPIVARLERDGFVPIVYEPPALLSYDLFEASEDLGDVVEQVLEETGQSRIDILAECTGGVIARHYIQSLGGDETVSRMVTFVSPQQGVAKAPWAALIAGWPALYDLSPGSEFLTAVNEAPLPESVPFTSIYTCDDEYIQPYTTSIIPGANNIGLCDEKVGHFQTFYDPDVYLIMHEALTEPLPSDEPAPELPVEEPVEEPVEVEEEPARAEGDEPIEVESADPARALSPVEEPTEEVVPATDDPFGPHRAGDPVVIHVEAPRIEGAGCTTASTPTSGGAAPLALFALMALALRYRGSRIVAR